MNGKAALVAVLEEVMMVHFAHDPVEMMAANSFQNFHAKGLDYLCLSRSPQLTVKAYFYDCETANHAPEVVAPHDHRYPFSTTVLAGRSEHYRYLEMPEFLGAKKTHNAFNWRTPLLGGNGFEWSHEAALDRQSCETYLAGETYFCRADEVHTISIRTDRTVLLLCQFADVVPLGEPTTTYIPSARREPPLLTGLYEEMSEDRVRELLAILETLGASQ